MVAETVANSLMQGKNTLVQRKQTIKALVTIKVSQDGTVQQGRDTKEHSYLIL